MIVNQKKGNVVHDWWCAGLGAAGHAGFCWRHEMQGREVISRILLPQGRDVQSDPGANFLCRKKRALGLDPRHSEVRFDAGSVEK